MRAVLLVLLAVGWTLFPAAAAMAGEGCGGAKAAAKHVFEQADVDQSGTPTRAE